MLLKWALLFKKGIVVVNIRYYLGPSVGEGWACIRSQAPQKRELGKCL
jgi:hypothetical protein